MNAQTITSILFASLRVTTPYLLAGMGGLISKRANLLNIALEGLMLFGAFFTVVFGSYIGNTWLGLLASLILVILLTVIYAIAVIEFQANQVVAGLAINILARGLTSYLLVVLFGVHGAYSPEGLESLPHIKLPVTNNIPFVGDILSEHGILMYLSWILVFVVSFMFSRTKLGLYIRAVGEHKEAAETAGIPVKKIQYLALILSGGFAALAGSQLSVGNLTLFTDNMINGRGFIAIAAVFFGSNKPWLTALGCFIFGIFEVLQFRLQTTTSIPSQLPQMLPYLIVVIVLTIISIKDKSQKKVKA